MNVPEHLKYSLNHEWVNDSVQPAEVGITAFAAEALGDVIYVQLPEPGSHLTAGDVCGEVESTKSVAELYLPVSGEVVAVNEAVIANPGLIGADPYGKGWLLRVRLAQMPSLMSPDEYRAFSNESR
ncbi:MULTISPECIES: glycine cleavage system protein GcvH [Micromonospora]|uniref:Glycine cleavage system H protein n=2 Tax=Micromonospora aurantiaca (nom. illeg.) TaxID=47850 RepID=A0A6N3KAE0_9ACTN|nr:MULTISPECIES: glycine cleavage system protein GcvH [Micromonospora]ADU09849.1 glycine cleavage system H protein [Micromonospora sp. L5]AXH93454.1 glycine cleavage system protein GcvH [Micromonospora aurantiaca]MBC9000360.1 glycine cleavage system protein GcvH [Micromonospora aurantiaca]OHX07096.1 glycine cleavage system protein H [Micromonospora sp. WMMB235]